MVAHSSGKLSNGACLEVPLFKGSEIMSGVLIFLSYVYVCVYTGHSEAVVCVV